MLVGFVLTSLCGFCTAIAFFVRKLPKLLPFRQFSTSLYVTLFRFPHSLHTNNLAPKPTLLQYLSLHELISFQLKERVAELAEQYKMENFLDKFPEKDAGGLVIPQWKRQMMAKKAAEKAKKEAEERLIKELEEKRKNAIPAWKKQLKKKEDNYGSPAYIK